VKRSKVKERKPCERCSRVVASMRHKCPHGRYCHFGTHVSETLALPANSCPYCPPNDTKRPVLVVGDRVVVRVGNGLVRGSIDSMYRKWVVLRVEGILESVSNVAGSEAWTLVAFSYCDLVEIEGVAKKRVIEIRFELDGDAYPDPPKTTEEFMELARDVVEGTEDLPEGTVVTIACDGAVEDWTV